MHVFDSHMLWVHLEYKKIHKFISSGFFSTSLLISLGSLSTVVGDEKLTSREDQIGLLFLYIQSDENTLPKVDKIFKTEAQTFNIFDKLIGPLQFCIWVMCF